LITAGALGVYGYGRLRYGPGLNAGTNAFMSLTFAQLLHAYRCRSESTSIFNRESRPANRYLDSAVGLSSVLQIMTVALPPLRRLLGLSPIGVFDMIMILAGAGLPLLANEKIKVMGKNNVNRKMQNDQ
jgi:Ca2+-transporting ATPase